MNDLAEALDVHLDKLLHMTVDEVRHIGWKRLVEQAAEIQRFEKGTYNIEIPTNNYSVHAFLCEKIEEEKDEKNFIFSQLLNTLVGFALISDKEGARVLAFEKADAILQREQEELARQSSLFP